MTFVASRISALVFIVVAFMIGAWIWAHSEEGDPKNAKYLLWKAQLYEMDPQAVGKTMLRDSQRDKLVVGKTKDQLKHQFGPLLPLDQVSKYYELGYKNYYDGKDVLL